ncbi:MAG: EscU/YscU/HrcU family type III secretion system export apparatus switch protein [Clostridiaceae bacterium]|nr:EscU/YscU/HrcU family type III secretion system export apparatus switch protein [Clostridiaceae bacterium]
MKNQKKAIALRYDDNYDAPIVTAAGMGKVADKIIEKAKENQVPIVVNEEMANLLNNVDVGDSIPQELYGAIAEIIAFVMNVDKKLDRR